MENCSKIILFYHKIDLYTCTYFLNIFIPNNFVVQSELSEHLQKVAERERELSGLREQQQLQREPPGGGGQTQLRDDEEPPGR